MHVFPLSSISLVLFISCSTVITSTSPTVSPVLVGGVNAAAVAVPIVLILLLVVIATVVGVVLLVYFSLLLVRKGLSYFDM